VDVAVAVFVVVAVFVFVVVAVFVVVGSALKCSPITSTQTL
jgi:hypothetical protein